MCFVDTCLFTRGLCWHVCLFTCRWSAWIPSGRSSPSRTSSTRRMTPSTRWRESATTSCRPSARERYVERPCGHCMELALTIRASIPTRSQHRLGLGGSLYSVFPCHEGSCTVKSNASWVMVTWDWTFSYLVDRQTRLITLPSRNFVGRR